VDGVAVLHEHVVLHLVATGAEGLGVGRFHGGVEPAPEDDATEEAHQQDDQRAAFDGDLKVVHRRFTKPGNFIYGLLSSALQPV
jgi:hypothetical protein